MKKTLFILLCMLPMLLMAQIKVTFPESFADGWDKYYNQFVQFDQPLYVCGVFYDSLIVSTERRYVPEEHAVGLADGDSTRYWELVNENNANMIKVTANYWPYNVHTGSVLKNFKARVLGDKWLSTGQSPVFKNNKPSKKLPKIEGASLLVCGANIQNFFCDPGGYAGQKTHEQFVRQTEMVAGGLAHMNADIYALCEMGKGTCAVQALVDKMNSLKHKDIYAWIDNGWTDGDTITCCFVYRKDKVRPYGETYFAYNDESSLYHYRMMINAFEEIATGERFAININHPRSKRGEASYSNGVRMQNMDSILAMLNRVKSENLFDDEDILLVGDYNCYTQEQPLQYLVRNGYEDVLMRYDSTGYSYVYKGEMGYLDRAFANPSMAAQVTDVHPVHLNADCFYSWWYKKPYNKTFHRYSDHDPILIGIKLGKKK